MSYFRSKVTVESAEKNGRNVESWEMFVDCFKIFACDEDDPHEVEREPDGCRVHTLGLEQQKEKQKTNGAVRILQRSAM